MVISLWLESSSEKSEKYVGGDEVGRRRRIPILFAMKVERSERDRTIRWVFRIEDTTNL